MMLTHRFMRISESHSNSRCADGYSRVPVVGLGTRLCGRWSCAPHHLELLTSASHAMAARGDLLASLPSANNVRGGSDALSSFHIGRTLNCHA